MAGLRTSVGGGVGRVVLDRPEALNALDLAMVTGLASVLDAWRDDDAVRAVVVSSSSPKAFCAGGDIRELRRSALDGDADALRGYFGAEYALDAAVASFPKPYVSLIDGFALGGGLGISVHGRYRVVTERASLAMPETAIGFFPDIGARRFLPGLRGATGMYMGLTGNRVSGAAAAECGLATHYVDSAELPALTEALTSGDGTGVGALLDRYATTAPPSELHGRHDVLDRCFGAPSLDTVVERLAAEAASGSADAEWAAEALATLRGASPSGLVLTFAVLSAGAGGSLAECFADDLRLAVRAAFVPDFAEGVRAMLVDKDRRPAWAPATLEELAPAARAELLALLD